MLSTFEKALYLYVYDAHLDSDRRIWKKLYLALAYYFNAENQKFESKNSVEIFIVWCYHNKDTWYNNIL